MPQIVLYGTNLSAFYKAVGFPNCYLLDIDVAGRYLCASLVEGEAPVTPFFCGFN